MECRPYPTNLSLSVLRSDEELSQIRTYWEAHQCHPNSALDLFRITLSSRPEIIRPNIIVLSRNGSPVAMLVGRLEHQRLRVTLGYKSFLGPHYRCMVYIYQGLLGDHSAEHTEYMVREAFRDLTDGEADAIYFSGVDAGSHLCVAGRAGAGLLTRDRFPEERPHWILEVPPTIEQFYQRLSTKVRSKRRQEASRLLRAFEGKIRIECFRRLDDIEQMCRDIELVARLTYQRGMNTGFTLSPETLQRLRVEASCQRLRGYVLYAAERPCAFLVGSVYQNTVFWHYTGYDPSTSRYSPGAYLLLKCVEDACGSQVERMDFGFGHAWYKEMFCTRSWNESSFYVFSPTLKGRSLNLIRTPPLFAVNTVKRIVGAAHLADRIKRRWRDALRRRVRKGVETTAPRDASQTFTAPTS